MRTYTLAVTILILATATSIALGANPSQMENEAKCPEVDFTNFDTSPAFLDSVAPDYPVMARRAQIEGEVILEIFINADGTICEVKTIQKINPLLENAASTAVKESTFHPATRNGKLVPGIFGVSYLFSQEIWNYQHRREVEPPIDLETPLVSEVGKEADRRKYKDGELPIIEFEGVKFYGDISLQIYRRAVAQVDSLLAEDEGILHVFHHLVYPLSVRKDFEFHGDLEFMTHLRGRSRGNGRGRYFKFINMDGNYVLSRDGSTTHWMH